MNAKPIERCPRCGKASAEDHKYCAECGMFLRDPWIDQRLLAPLVLEQVGKSKEARRELERLLEIDADHPIANLLLG
ncbi:MAG TPA: hypothetical protein VLV48_04630, partial [Thermoanaerobaculia bacterium]|nr:hypothetical protein [Thermoanaerobaculia bacterium]